MVVVEIDEGITPQVFRFGGFRATALQATVYKQQLQKKLEGGFMKKVVAGLLVMFLTASLFAQTYVDGYFKKDGTYVQPHYRTAPDASLLNNYSTKGNINPYTGQAGTVNPYATQTNQLPTQQPLGVWCQYNVTLGRNVCK